MGFNFCSTNTAMSILAPGYGMRNKASTKDAQRSKTCGDCAFPKGSFARFFTVVCFLLTLSGEPWGGVVICINAQR